MNILFIGDIFGRPGREAVKKLLPAIVENEEMDFVIANAENAAGGKGLNPRTADELFTAPINVITGGNHIWEHKTIHSYFDTHNILRPYNVDDDLPGRGWGVFECKGINIAVICLQGQIFMDEKGKKAMNPFNVIDRLIDLICKSAKIIIVDFHAEATSEKRAFAWHVNGRVSAVIGTHTHVQTSDEEIMPGGTAYITDVGMTGPHASVIGLDKSVALHRFLTGDQKGFKVAKGGVRMEAVRLEIDESSGLAERIKRIRIVFDGGIADGRDQKTT